MINFNNNKIVFGVVIVISLLFIVFSIGRALIPSTPSLKIITNINMNEKEESRLDGLVKIIEIKEGSGKEAVVGKNAAVKYIGKTLNENGQEFIFDSGNFSFDIGSGKVIAGFDVGILGMKVAGKRILIIKPEAGYGDQVVGPIPANSTLTFDIELLDIK